MQERRGPSSHGSPALGFLPRRKTAAHEYTLLPVSLVAQANMKQRGARFVRNTLFVLSIVITTQILYFRGFEWRGPKVQMTVTLSRAPTVGIIDFPANRRLLDYYEGCHWNYSVQTLTRTSTVAAYGSKEPVQDLPYILTEQNQFALDDILTTRFQTYPHVQPYPTPPGMAEPDFLFFPFYSTLHTILGGKCPNPPEYYETVQEVTDDFLAFAAALPNSTYPRLILPISLCRVDQNKGILTQQRMAKLRDRVLLLGIETDPLYRKEGMKVAIDVPYPTRFHLPLETNVDWRATEPTNFFLEHKRPYLIHYAGSSKLGGQKAIDGVNGVRLRSVLSTTLNTYIAETANGTNSAATRVIFDDFASHFPSFKFINTMYQHLTESTFSLEPPGDTPTRRGFYDAILNGAIPVIFRRNTYAHLLPSSPEMDSDLYSIFIDEKEIIAGTGGTVIERLEQIPEEEIRRKQEHLRKIARKLQYSLPVEEIPLPLSNPTQEMIAARTRGTIDYEEDAFGMILKELDLLRRGAWEQRLKT